MMLYPIPNSQSFMPDNTEKQSQSKLQVQQQQQQGNMNMIHLQTQQHPLPVKKRRGRPPKELGVDHSPSALSEGIFATSYAAAHSAAALKVGSPETKSPLMRVSPDRKRRSESGNAGYPKNKKSKNNEFTPTKPSPLSEARETSLVTVPPSSSKKLSEITGKKSKRKRTTKQQKQEEEQQQQQDIYFAKPMSTPKSIKNKNDSNNLMLSSPLLNLQQPSSFVKQYDSSNNTSNSSDMIFGQGNIPLTPASQFTSMIHSSPLYQNYFGEALTPLIGRKFNFDTNFNNSTIMGSTGQKIKFDDDDAHLSQQQQQQQQHNPLQQFPHLATQRSYSATIIDTIGRNISNENVDPFASSTNFHHSNSFSQLVSSSPVRPNNYLKKSRSSAVISTTITHQDSNSNYKPLPSLPRNRKYNISLTIGSDGKASITKEVHREEDDVDDEDEEEEEDSLPILQQPPIKATPRQTIRPSMMMLNSSPALMTTRDTTIDNLKSIILPHNDEDDKIDGSRLSSRSNKKGGKLQKTGSASDIKKMDSDARSALMRAFKRAV